MKAFIIGFSSFFKGIYFSLTKFGVWFLIPIFLWVVLYVSLSLLITDWAISVLYDLVNWLTGIDLSLTYELDSWQNIMKFVFHWGMNLTLIILIWYILGRYMKYAILILLSPLFAYISEKTEEKITGKNYPFSLKQFLNDVLRGVTITVRNLIIESIFIAIGSIISFFFPVVSPFILIILFIINSYFMGYNFFDYIAERKRMGIMKSTRYMRKNAMTLLGFGVAFNIVSWVPLLDWVLAPIAAASGAVIADEQLPEGKNTNSFN